MIGFVFAPSTRKITIQQAKEITRLLPPSIEKVGVFVQPNLTYIHSVAQEVGLTMIQLHGEAANLATKSLNYPVIRSLSSDMINNYDFSFDPPTYYLIDSPPGKYEGGSGISFDWNMLQKTEIALPPFILAGGLHQDNVAQAIQQTACIGVDVSSGVETNGEKDTQKIMTFLQEAKGARQ